ncbi:MAG TPA: hypothetical protein ENN13_01490 [Candidatus Altiarchaeales archaeon]|nr:hypothetical protein [Candidatus Altiarchaeales archaeon]
MDNYRKVSGMKGEDWRKESAKYEKIVKKDLEIAQKKIHKEVKENPGAAVIVSSVVGAITGAFLMSKLKK